LAYATIRRRLSVIAGWAMNNGASDPRKSKMVKNALEKASNVKKGKAVRRLAVLEGGMQAMIDRLDADYEAGVYASKQQSLLYLRDRLAILMLHTGVMSRIELATLHLEDAREVGGTLKVWVNPSGEMINPDKSVTWAKPDRLREIVFVPADDPRYDVRIAYARWRNATGLVSGYLMRGVREGGVLTNSLHPNIIRSLVARAAVQAGLAVQVADDSEMAAPRKARISISPRSLRAGAIGDRARAGASIGQLEDAAGVSMLQDGLADAAAQAKTLTGHPRTIVLNG
jgi:hypothetical protein